MQQGSSWRKAVQTLGEVAINRSRAYSLLKQSQTAGDGEFCWQDNRHGHPVKFRPEVRQWLHQLCLNSPQLSSHFLQMKLREQFQLEVSTSQINRVRVQLGIPNHSAQPSTCQKPEVNAAPLALIAPSSSVSPLKTLNEAEVPVWQEGAGSLLLLAAAQQTNLLTVLQQQITLALTQFVPSPAQNLDKTRLLHQLPFTRRRLLETLLFLPVAQLKRIWDLRSYTGQLLANVVEGDHAAYSYRQTARFLSELAHTGCTVTFTKALAAWTSQLWHAEVIEPPQASNLTGKNSNPPVFYIDGHHKPVYSQKRVPRGLVGKFGKVLGCRALTLLCDEKGHPLLVITARGDTHLTVGLPEIIEQYEQALTSTATLTTKNSVQAVVADREIMSATLLAAQTEQKRVMISLLDTNQYQGLASFQGVGDFVAWQYDKAGRPVREVAPAQFELSLPKQSTEAAKTLSLSVALIRDHRRQVEKVTALKADQTKKRTRAIKPRGSSSPPPPRKPITTASGDWCEASWEAAATPSCEKEAKLIPIVTTGEMTDPVQLAELYARRWVCQENVFKDWLLPLGLDTNHGYTHRVVANSEIKRKQLKVEAQLKRLKERTDKTRTRMKRASKLSQGYFEKWRKVYKQLERGTMQRQLELEASGLSWSEVKSQLNQEFEPLREKCHRLRDLYNQNYCASNDEFEKLAGYCAKQSDLLRDIAELKSREEAMIELDDSKDQLMSVLKVALANLVMWVRDNYFPADYRHSTWKRLLPYFKLGGWVRKQTGQVAVELVGFNDRSLNRDLAELCEKINKEKLELPSGQQLTFKLKLKQASKKDNTKKKQELREAS